MATKYGSHSHTWKRLLNGQLLRDPERLVRRLQGAGIELASLRSALEHWASPPSTVIHAPRKQRHFMSLMRVLGEFDSSWSNEKLWKKAWDEVFGSRSNAIQAGMHEQEQMHERLLVTLRSMTQDIATCMADGASFTLPAPHGSGLAGNFMFMRIISLEEGFRAPDREMRIVHNIASFSEWLV
jgi:hypothetical protein